MQRIERYGVIALVFLLVTIVAVSLWGEREKTDGVFSFLDRDSKTARIEELLAEASSERVAGSEEARPRGLADDGAPLSEGAWQPVGGSAYRGPETPPAHFDEYAIPASNSSIAPETLDSRIDYTPEPALVAEPTTETLPPPAAKPTAAREYTIRSGDTLSQIAMRELGTKDRWRELVELNPGLDPARLHVGTKIRLSGAAATSGASAPATAKATPAKAPAATGEGARSYTIRSGDTLSQIAMRELGTKDRWRELVELNPGLDPARLHVGTKIRLPGGAVAGAAAPREAPETRVARNEAVPSTKQSGSKVR